MVEGQHPRLVRSLGAGHLDLASRPLHGDTPDDPVGAARSLEIAVKLFHFISPPQEDKELPVSVFHLLFRADKCLKE